MTYAVFNAQLTINNITTAYVPNSLTFTEGKPEGMVRAQASGGGYVQNVVSQNIETAISMVKFSLYNTLENMDLLRIWQSNLDANAITLSDINTGFTRSFPQCVVTTDPERNLGSDGTIDVEFKGGQAF
jgi:hypothetical protein